MKAAADVLGGALLLRMKNALREYILYYQCRIFTCFHSQVHQTLVKNQTWSNLRLAALFKWYLRRSGVLLSLVPACQCPGGHGGHGGRDWEVGGKVRHQVQVCEVSIRTRFFVSISLPDLNLTEHLNTFDRCWYACLSDLILRFCLINFFSWTCFETLFQGGRVFSQGAFPVATRDSILPI